MKQKRFLETIFSLRLFRAVMSTGAGDSYGVRDLVSMYWNPREAA